MKNGDILAARVYPSPHPHIRLTELTYASCGLPVKGMIAEPLGCDRPLEGLLYLRGGMNEVGMVRPARIAQIAARGFRVFAPYYRGARGGHGKDEFGGEDRYDAVYGADVLKSWPGVRDERLHILSFSRGGIMALWTAILRRDITSLVSWSGVSDVALTYEEKEDMRRMMKRVIGGTPKKVPEAYEERTPLKEVGKIHCPVLLIHGKEDVNVSYEHAQLLEEACLEAGVDVESWFYGEQTHFFTPAQNRTILDEATEWMKAKPTVGRK